MSDDPKSKLMTEREAMRLVWLWARIAFLFGISTGVLVCVIWTAIMR